MKNYFLNYYSFIFSGRVVLDINPWERTKLRTMFLDGQPGNPCITEAVVTSAFWVDRHGFFIFVFPTEFFFNKIIILLLNIYSVIWIFCAY